MEITTVDFHHRKSFKMGPRPLMLKDYLRDDMSSCSSNGFKSLPRQQCCTTVQFLLEIDLKAAPPTPSKRRLRKSSPRSPATASVLQRASVKLLNAVKLLQFQSAKSPSGSVAKKSKPRSRKGLLPRSLYRKLWKRSFWKKPPRRGGGREEIGRGRSVEKRSPLADQNATSAVVPHRLSISSSSSKNRRNSSSWESSEFTAELAPSPSGDWESSGRPNGVVVEDKDLVPRGGPHDERVNDKVGVTHGQDSITATPTCSKQEWPNEEKEQFSPVSVLDCPFKDDEDLASPEWSPSRIGGARQKLKQKARRCGTFSRLKPVQLERRIALSELEDEAPVQYWSSTPSPSFVTEDQEDEREIEKKIRELLGVAMGINPSFTSKVDILLLDFFRERLEEEQGASKIAIGGSTEFESKLLKLAEGWMYGQPQEVFLGWEVEDGRHAYIKDMERRERWRNVDEEKMEVALDLEVEVWSSLMGEVLLDIFS